MAEQTSVRVAIHGRTYELWGADPNRTRELARKVDKTMRTFSQQIRGADNYKLAILTALHIADELSDVRSEFAAHRAAVDASATRLLEAIEAVSDGDS